MQMINTKIFSVNNIIITEYNEENNKSYIVEYKNKLKKKFKCSSSAYFSESEKLIYDNRHDKIRIFDLLGRRSKNYPASSEIITLDRYLYIIYGNNIMIIRRCNSEIIFDGVGYINLGRCDDLFIYYTLRNRVLLVYSFSEKGKSKIIFKAIDVIDCEFELNYENLITRVKFDNQIAIYDIDIYSGICKRIEE